MDTSGFVERLYINLKEWQQQFPCDQFELVITILCDQNTSSLPEVDQ